MGRARLLPPYAQVTDDRFLERKFREAWALVADGLKRRLYPSDISVGRRPFTFAMSVSVGIWLGPVDKGDTPTRVDLRCLACSNTWDVITNTAGQRGDLTIRAALREKYPDMECPHAFLEVRQPEWRRVLQERERGISVKGYLCSVGCRATGYHRPEKWEREYEPGDVDRAVTEAIAWMSGSVVPAEAEAGVSESPKGA